MKIEKLVKELRKELRKDILERYDNSEYWDPELMDEFLQNKGVEDEEMKEKIIKKLIEEEEEEI
jgi:hypothetical protein